MQKLFNNILIPVDFSSQSKKAIEKAVDIAKQYECGIHLIHVITSSVFSTNSIHKRKMYMPGDVTENETELEFELDRLCRSIINSSDSIKTVKWSISAGSWNEIILDSIIRHKIDLVLIGLEPGSNRTMMMFLNPDKIAARANVPVITVPSDRRMVRLNSIVIPITDFLPVRKLIYAVYLAKEYDSTLMLIGITNANVAEKVIHYTDKSIKLVHDICNLTVQTDFVIGKNVAKLVYQYAIKKYADLVILNPGSQTKMPGLFSSFRGNTIQKYSIPPVLAVNPLQGF